MNWLYQPDDPLSQTIAGSLLMFIIIIVISRIIGLRSFAKFTTFDFAFTVAIGSIVAAILTSSTSILHGSVAIASLLGFKLLFARLQRNFPRFDDAISNDPLLLMLGSEILEENLKAASVDKSQVIAKLREANVLDFNQVEAVVLETTGDISVLHQTSSQHQDFNKKLLQGVRENP